MSLHASDTTPPLARAAGPTCERSTLPPWLRLAIMLGVLLALKHLLLPPLGLPPTAQVLALLGVASAFVWRFWWHCNPDRRAALFLLAVLWAAGLAKIVLQ